MLTKEIIVNMLKTDKRAVARALVVLHRRQTYDEQAQEGTRYLNGRGFRPCHARMGSSMAKQFERNGFLSDKQIEYWRKPDKTGAMRIGIYWAQLLEEAELKAKEQVPIRIADAPPRSKSSFHATIAKEQELPVVNVPLARDFGNDMERRVVLEEEYGMTLDSDDPKLYGPIKDEIDAIDAFWNKIRGNK